MARNKPPWVKTNFTIELKNKLWRIMKGNPTYERFQNHIAHNPDLFTKLEWKELGIDSNSIIRRNQDDRLSLLSRDTFKVLQDEIREMPLKEVASLPTELHNWARGMKGDTDLKLSMEEIIKRWDDHYNDLADAAGRLADNLIPYLKESQCILEDFVVGTTEKGEIDLEEQLQSDTITTWLLAHMKEDMAELKDIGNWLDISTNMINSRLIDTLIRRAKDKEFKGKCDYCRNLIS